MGQKFYSRLNNGTSIICGDFVLISSIERLNFWFFVLLDKVENSKTIDD